MAAFFYAIDLQRPLGWPAELWTGTIFFAGIAGVAISLLARPSPPPLAAP
jgi:hypothetical protein